MVKEFIKNARLNDIYVDEEYETITYYFTITLDALSWYLPNSDSYYPEATGCEISIEFHNKLSLESEYADVMISPIMKANDGTEDYSYTCINMEYEDIEWLIDVIYDSCYVDSKDAFVKGE